MDWCKRFGRAAEDAAAAFLAGRGVHILKRNFRCRIGEIDLIGKEGDMYLMIEVKARMDQGQGFPGEAVDRWKQDKICRAFDYYRMRNHLHEDTPVRFDVIELDSKLEIRWIKNAFDYIGRQV